jgi:hypothetical protein
MCYTCAQIVTQLPTLLGYGDVFVRVSLCTRFAIVFSLSLSNMHNPQHFHFRLEIFLICMCAYVHLVIMVCAPVSFPQVFTSFSTRFHNPQHFYLQFLFMSFHIILNSFLQSPTTLFCLLG